MSLSEASAHRIPRTEVKSLTIPVLLNQGLNLSTPPIVHKALHRTSEYQEAAFQLQAVQLPMTAKCDSEHLQAQQKALKVSLNIIKQYPAQTIILASILHICKAK